MIVDVSHTGERTTLDAMAASSKPVLITHSNCKALVPHPRCKSDEVIRAMSKQGGVMGITCVGTFLRRSSNASLEDALDHIAHTARIAGVEHVGIGSDKDVAENPLRVYRLTEGMLRRRWTPEHIRLVLAATFSVSSALYWHKRRSRITNRAICSRQQSIPCGRVLNSAGAPT